MRIDETRSFNIGKLKQPRGDGNIIVAVCQEW